jgi:outer membrane protein TolC
MKTVVTAILICLFVSSQAQSILDGYIREGLRNNESIHEQNFLLEKNLFALKQAKSLFFPNVTFNTSYFGAAGGRTVDFPVGDLLNPVYTTLNQLTGSSKFPVLKNQSILLNPDNFYDAHIRTTVPLINAEIYYNYQLKANEASLQQTEINLYKRELVKEIKIAYYRYAQATEAVKIYANALSLVKENQRINHSLFNNQKINRTAVARSDNEVTKMEAQLTSAEEKSKTALAYFNFLLNRSADEPVAIDTDETLRLPDALADTSVHKREEMLKMQTAKDINTTSLKLSRSYLLPKLNAFVDVGSQGFDWKFGNKNHYYFFGLSLDWTLFGYGRNSYRIKQVQSEEKAIEAQTNYVEAQLRLQLNTALHNYNSALTTYKAAQSTLTSSEKYFNDMVKLYKEGMALFIELLDAQNEYVNASLQLNIALYDTQIKLAEIERANAGFNLQNL